MRGAGLNASWSGVIPTMGLSVPVVMDPLCGIARGCDDIFAPGDGNHDDGDGWCRAAWHLLLCLWRSHLHEECRLGRLHGLDIRVLFSGKGGLFGSPHLLFHALACSFVQVHVGIRFFPCLV